MCPRIRATNTNPNNGTATGLNGLKLAHRADDGINWFTRREGIAVRCNPPRVVISQPDGPLSDTAAWAVSDTKSARSFGA